MLWLERMLLYITLNQCVAGLGEMNAEGVASTKNLFRLGGKSCIGRGCSAFCIPVRFPQRADYEEYCVAYCFAGRPAGGR
jgi:hypothetical protein